MSQDKLKRTVILRVLCWLLIELLSVPRGAALPDSDNCFAHVLVAVSQEYACCCCCCLVGTEPSVILSYAVCLLLWRGPHCGALCSVEIKGLRGKRRELIRLGLLGAACLTAYVDRRGGHTTHAQQLQQWSLLWPPLQRSLLAVTVPVRRLSVILC